MSYWSSHTTGWPQRKTINDWCKIFNVVVQVNDVPEDILNYMLINPCTYNEFITFLDVCKKNTSLE